ncbi:baseplate J/gp47 family protein [Brevibacillus laterosporus]|uniref:baseplate J/gp47 family protein n=1 Tax=Brevibacillus laterosporus TaxID=1465 RepID=UPI000E6C7602|nr:baseplate J/gp47 family protein [Brevibacillus laterosporus]AYB39960.1 baseplate J/gp47 family protein [Brevibacillus laterosporus]
MYEDQTFDVIMNRVLDSIKHTLDKREGSIIYDAASPTAVEIAQVYTAIMTSLRIGFIETSSGEFLRYLAHDNGIEIKDALPAKRKGIFYDQNNEPMDIPLESRFSIDILNYKAIERIKKGEYVLICETPGIVGNQVGGTLIPTDYIDGLAKAELTDILEPGAEEESEEEIKKRLLFKVRMQATSGNKAHYIIWATSVEGVGAAKVIPLWNGPGTVKVIIIDPKHKPVINELIAKTAEYIETVRPIGPAVTVKTATAKKIDVNAKIKLIKGAILAEVIQEFQKALDEYYFSISFNEPVVSYAKVSSILLGIKGVIDHSDLTVNGKVANAEIGQEEVPVVGTVTLVE